MTKTTPPPTYRCDGCGREEHYPTGWLEVTALDVIDPVAPHYLIMRHKAEPQHFCSKGCALAQLR